MTIKLPGAGADTWWLSAAVAFGALAAVPLLLWGVPGGNDLPHHFRVALGFYDSLQTGDLYPSWLAATNQGAGDPSVRFYPPGLYILLSVFRSVFGDWYVATIAVFTALTMIGSLGAYLYASTISASRYAIIAAAMWPLMPFHTNELFQAAMYGQYAAASVVPFVFAFLERIFLRGDRLDVVLLAISFALIVLFHVPMAVFVAIAIAGYTLVRCFQRRNVKASISVFAGCSLGLTVAAFYWVTAISEVGWKYPSAAGQGDWFDYRNNFLFTTSPSEEANYWIPIMFGVSALIFLPLLLNGLKGISKILPVIVLTAFTFLLSTSISKPLWDALPPLQETQFPWRWLTLTSLFMLIAAVAGVERLGSMSGRTARPFLLLSVGALAIVASFSFSQIMRAGLYHEKPEFDQTVEDLRGSKTNQDFLPVWAGKNAVDQTEEVRSIRYTEVTQWLPEHKSFKIADGPAEEVTLGLYYYPRWKAFTSKGNAVELRPSPIGSITLTAPEGEAVVNIDFVEPLISRVADVISGVAAAVCIFLVVSGIRRRRRALA